jgi:hypothetical protein
MENVLELMQTLEHFEDMKYVRMNKTFVLKLDSEILNLRKLSQYLSGSEKISEIFELLQVFDFLFLLLILINIKTFKYGIFTQKVLELN